MGINIEDIVVLQDAAEVRFGDDARVVFAADHAVIESDDFSYDDHWTTTHACLDHAVFSEVAGSGLAELLAAIAAAAPAALGDEDRAVGMRHFELAHIVARTRSMWVRDGKPDAGLSRDALRHARSNARAHTRANSEALARFNAHQADVKRADAEVKRLRGELQQALDRLLDAHRVPAAPPA